MAMAVSRDRQHVARELAARPFLRAVHRACSEQDVTQADIAELMEQALPTLSNKIHGHDAFPLHEAVALAKALRDPSPLMELSEMTKPAIHRPVSVREMRRQLRQCRACAHAAHDIADSALEDDVIDANELGETLAAWDGLIAEAQLGRMRFLARYDTQKRE